jgi:NAD(P)-dependent dehydrogenase (short-subunit alcohol dehydrogenase family)
MKARNYGRIVNIASVAGKDGNPNASAYSASKAAAEVDHPDLITAQRVRCYSGIPMVTNTISGMT